MTIRYLSTFLSLTNHRNALILHLGAFVGEDRVYNSLSLHSDGHNSLQLVTYEFRTHNIFIHWIVADK